MFARMLSHPPSLMFFSDIYLCLDIDTYLEILGNIERNTEIWGNMGIYISSRARIRIEREIIKPTKLIGKERASLLYINRYFYLNTYQSSRFYFFTLIHIYMHLST